MRLHRGRRRIARKGVIERQKLAPKLLRHNFSRPAYARRNDTPGKEQPRYDETFEENEFAAEKRVAEAKARPRAFAEVVVPTMSNYLPEQTKLNA